MKKFTLFLFLALVFPVIGITSTTTEFTQETTVYVTKSGTKYHTGSCSYLKGGGIAISLSDAQKTYSPCSRCNPGMNSKSISPQTTAPSNSTYDTKTIHTGPRGGRYHYSKNGNKVYERKR